MPCDLFQQSIPFGLVSCFSFFTHISIFLLHLADSKCLINIRRMNLAKNILLIKSLNTSTDLFPQDIFFRYGAAGQSIWHIKGPDMEEDGDKTVAPIGWRRLVTTLRDQGGGGAGMREWGWCLVGP